MDRELIIDESRASDTDKHLAQSLYNRGLPEEFVLNGGADIKWFHTAAISVMIKSDHLCSRG
jgi:hypothetical protein